MLPPTITWTGDFLSKESMRLKSAFDAVEADQHKLSNKILTFEGMSGVKYRKLINNLIEQTPKAKYLEIGCCTGSTAFAAMYNNKMSITCIDNFSWSETCKSEFHQNTQDIVNKNIKLTVIEKDFRSVDYQNIGKHNVFMYDGPHEYQDQYDGISITQPALDDCFTLIIDDYNASRVQAATMAAIQDLNLKILTSLTIITTPGPGEHNEKSDWHFGYYLAVLQKG